MLVLLWLMEQKNKRNSTEVKIKLYLKWESQADNCEESAEKTRYCFRNTRHRLKISLVSLILRLSSLIKECIVEHGGISPRDKTRTKSKYKFSEEKSPKSISNYIPTKSNCRDESAYEYGFFTTEYIRKVSCRDLKKNYSDSKTCLYNKYLLMRESMFTIKYRHHRHDEEKPPHSTEYEKYDDVTGEEHECSLNYLIPQSIHITCAKQ